MKTTRADPPAAAVCAAFPSSSPKISNEDKEKLVANNFCDRFAKGQPTVKADFKIEHLLWTPPGSSAVQDWDGKDAQDDVYIVSMKATEGCPIPDGGEKVNLAEPFNGRKCGDLLYHAWKDC